jgi:CRISPR system Cascade subunit CasE
MSQHMPQHLPLHMIQLRPNVPALIRWAERQRLLDPADRQKRADDLGYALHAALTATFGDLAPRPFALHTDPGSLAELLGYTGHPPAALIEHAASFADPELAQALATAHLAGKTMPERFAEGRRLGFTLRARPTIRTDKNGDRTKIVERDAFREPTQGEETDGPTRGEVYLAWLQTRLAAGGAQLERATLDQYRRSVTLRRDKSRKLRAIDGPDAGFSGVLVVKDPAAFSHLLAQGVGRHGGFGYGMLLLRPA